MSSYSQEGSTSCRGSSASTSVSLQILMLLLVSVMAASCSQESAIPPAQETEGIPAQKPDVTASQAPEPALTHKITYAMPITLAAIPAYVALEKGFWIDEGLEVEAKMFSAGRLALDALLAEAAEVMSVSETPLMHAILKGNAIYIVTTVTEHQEAKAIARRDQGIEKPEDLVGKRVATLPGTNSDYFMYEFLSAHGLKPGDVQITNMKPPDMVTSFVSGDIQAYFAWEPHIFYSKTRVPDVSIVFPPGELYHGRHCVAMNQNFVREHPEIVEKLVRGFLTAETFVAEHPEEAKAIVATRTGMELPALEALWSEYKVRVRLDTTLVEILEKEGRWARGLEQSQEPLPDFSEFIYTSALRKERPAAVDGLP